MRLSKRGPLNNQTIQLSQEGCLGRRLRGRFAYSRPLKMSSQLPPAEGGGQQGWERLAWATDGPKASASPT